MALTEQEELELLELEEQEALTSKPQQMRWGLAGSVPEEQYQQGQRNVLGNIFDRPAGAVRSALSGTGGAEGFLNPTNVKPPSEVLQGFLQKKLGNVGGNIVNSAIPQVGWMADIATDPTAIATLLVGSGLNKPVSKTVSSGKEALKNVLKWDNTLVQARKAKGALDNIRSTLGKAKEIALKDVENLPTNFDFGLAKSSKITNALSKPYNNIAFNPDGSVVNTIGNLDKVKSALGDLLTSKDYVEAGKNEKKHILQFAGEVRKEILRVTKQANKPELGETLMKYHDFMENFEPVNEHLVDKHGKAMANKLKAVFKPGAEEALKESWKEIGQSSPEIRKIIKSRESRELAKKLLKYSAVSGVLGGAAGGIRSLSK